MCGPKFCSMKISAEVREFARLNPSPIRSEPVEGLSAPSEEPGSALTVSARTEEEANAGMAQMSARYREGGDLYVPAAE